MHFVPLKYTGNFPTFRTSPTHLFVQNEVKLIVGVELSQPEKNVPVQDVIR